MIYGHDLKCSLNEVTAAQHASARFSAAAGARYTAFRARSRPACPVLWPPKSVYLSCGTAGGGHERGCWHRTARFVRIETRKLSGIEP